MPNTDIRAAINASFTQLPDGGLMVPNHLAPPKPTDNPHVKAQAPPEIDQTKVSRGFRHYMEHRGIQQHCKCGKTISRNKQLCSACKVESESLAERAKAAGLVLPQ